MILTKNTPRTRHSLRASHVVLVAILSTFGLSLNKVEQAVLDVDELYQLKLIAQPLSTFWENYWVTGHLIHIFFTKPFTAIAWDIFTLRFGSVVAAVISIPLIYCLARSLFDRRVAALSTLLLSVTHTHIRYAINIRGYSLLVMFSLLTVYCFSKAIGTGQRRWWLSLAIVLAINIHNHFFAVFLAVALLTFGIGWFWLKNPHLSGQAQNQLGQVVLAGSVVIFLLSPMPVMLLSGQDNADNLSYVLREDWITSFPPLRMTSAADVLWPISAPYFQMSYEFSPTRYRNWQTIGFVALFLIGLISGLRRSASRWVTVLFILILSTPLLMTLATTIFPWFHAFWRYFLFVMPVYLILGSRGLLVVASFLTRILAHVIKPAHLKLTYAGSLTLLLLPTVSPILTYTTHTSHPVEPHVISRYLHTHAKPGDLILCVPDQDWRIPSGRESCGVTLSLYPELAPNVYLLDQLATYENLQKFLDAKNRCINRSLHIPTFYFQMDCQPIPYPRQQSRNVWLVLWRTGESTGKTSPNLPVTASFDSTQIIYLENKHGLTEVLTQAGQIAIQESDTPLRKLENYISLAGIYLASSQLRPALDTLDEAIFVSRWPEAIEQLTQLQVRLSYLPILFAPKVQANVVWNNELALLGLDQDLNEIQPLPGSPILLSTYWQTLQPIADNYKVFVHLLNSAGQLVATFDYQPFDNHRPFGEWSPGQIIRETRIFDLPSDLSPGAYTLEMGLYQADTLARLPITGDPSGEAWTLAQFEVVKP